MKKFFVGNLSWKATEEQLKEFFETIGAVVSVKIVIDQMTGKSKGFAFIEMKNQPEAMKALQELNGKEVKGRALVVEEYAEKKK